MMYSLEVRTQSIWESLTGYSTSLEHRLAPATRYYICKLLRQPSVCESSEFLEFRARLSEDNCSRLNDLLHQLYPDAADRITVILKLDNLVYFHQSLASQTSLYPEHMVQLTRIQQEVFHLLGFSGVWDQY